MRYYLIGEVGIYSDSDSGRVRVSESIFSARASGLRIRVYTGYNAGRRHSDLEHKTRSGLQPRRLPTLLAGTAGGQRAGGLATTTWHDGKRLGDGVLGRVAVHASQACFR